MKAIVSLQGKDGKFATGNGMLRTIVESRTEAGLVIAAERFAHGKAYQVAVYRNSEPVGTPDNVITHK
jgi:hypothetical protein